MGRPTMAVWRERRDQRLAERRARGEETMTEPTEKELFEELAAAQAELNAAGMEIEVLKARNAELEAALAPFAAYAEMLPTVRRHGFPATGTLYSIGIRGRPGWIGLDAEDFDAARAALVMPDLPNPEKP